MNRAILIKSCQRFGSRRAACDETWASAIRQAQVQVWTLVGGEQQDYIPRSMNGGQLGVITGDSYSDNSLKLKAALAMLLDSREQFDTLFVCDDDTFVHPRRWMAHEPAGELECRVFRPKDNRRNGGHPWIHGGGGWWMSRRLCELYVEHCHERTSTDDILVANIAREHGIEMIDRPDLYAGDRYSGDSHRVRPTNQFITSHHVHPLEMYKLYEATREL